MTTIADRTAQEGILTPVWSPPGGGYWEGRWQEGERSVVVTDPEDGSFVGTVMDATVAEVDRAVGYVAERWQSTPWPLWRRREALEAAADRLRESTERFVELISAEGCKTVAESRREVARAEETLRLSARSVSELSGQTVAFDDSPRGDGWQGWCTREPLGVVAAITPFNDPLNLVAHKLGPALVAGNAVVLKPAESTPLTAYALVELLLECGVPGEYLAVVAGGAAGPALVADRRIDVLSFTGGPTTADKIAAGGPARKLLMELGGNNALIVCADADPDQVAGAVVSGAFGVAGQNCLSVQRVLVAEGLYEDVLARVVAGAAALVVGGKRDPRTDVGPLISEDAARRVEGAVAEAVALGATLHTGGVRTGSFVTPAVLTDVPASASVRTQEVFGPVVLLDEFSDVASAVASANAVETGLQAGVFTSDVTEALRVASGLRVGAVMINESSDFRIDAMPFGGFKRSGIGREGVAAAIRELTAPKVVAIRLHG
ncbi:aldehyde dehydrogenase family protein [Georgenia sp. SUBG003]|uniref:aldehyde dehydrogenase family protein n=1 Tax=Georgenia sp. SUBG003 TaxID=1497974 RepID=UPI0004D838B5|nr:aldehyde dehydrogenase [Georgenia sp. SUBG003]